MVLNDSLNGLKDSIVSFVEEEKYLLKKDANERSITHRLAIYVENNFDDFYSIDCEYNLKSKSESGKFIPMLESEIEKHKPDAKISSFPCRDGSKYRTALVYPDIIIHERDSSDDNLFIIEVKLSSGDGISYDKAKLKRYTSKDDQFEENLKYDFGVFISFNVGDDLEKNLDNICKNLIIYKNGEEIKSSVAEEIKNYVNHISLTDE